jgi:hypothetical protein
LEGGRGPVAQGAQGCKGEADGGGVHKRRRAQQNVLRQKVPKAPRALDTPLLVEEIFHISPTVLNKLVAHTGTSFSCEQPISVSSPCHVCSLGPLIEDAICEIPALAHVFARKRLRAAHAAEIDFAAWLASPDVPSQMAFEIDPLINSMLSSSDNNEDVFADHTANHMSKRSLTVLALFTLGLNEDRCSLPPVDDVICPGLYLVTMLHADGTIRACYVGTSSCGAFVSSTSMTGVCGCCQTYNLNSTSANPPKMQLYLSENGICLNPYKIGLLLAFNGEEVRKPVNR